MGLCERRHEPDGEGLLQDLPDERDAGYAHAGGLLRRLLRDGPPGRHLHPPFFLQERHPDGPGLVRDGRLPVHRRPLHGFLLAFPGGLFHPHLRPQLPGDQRQSLHPRDGRSGDGHPAAELRAVVQPHRLAVRHVRGDELHPGPPEPHGLRRPGHALRRGIRGDEAGRPGHPDQALRRHRPRHSGDVLRDPAREDAQGEGGQRKQHRRVAAPARRHPPLPGRRARTVLLRGRADHVLDLHHPVRHPRVHGSRDERNRCGSPVTEAPR